MPFTRSEELHYRPLRSDLPFSPACRNTRVTKSKKHSEPHSVKKLSSFGWASGDFGSYLISTRSPTASSGVRRLTSNVYVTSRLPLLTTNTASPLKRLVKLTTSPCATRDVR